MLGLSSVVDPELANAIQGLLKELSCPICLTLLNNPLQTPCGHTFCEACILRALRPRTNDDSQDLHKRPHDPCCPICKHKCNKRSLLAAPVLIQRSVERMRDVLFAFQQATDGITCSQYQPVVVKPQLEMEKLQLISEEPECNSWTIPSSPGNLFRSLEELKGHHDNLKESEEFETQRVVNPSIIPETQLLTEKSNNSIQINNEPNANDGENSERDTNELATTEKENINALISVVPETQFFEGLTSSPAAIIQKLPPPPIATKASTPTRRNKKTDTKSPKSTDFKNPKKRASKGEVSTPSERNKKENVGRPLGQISTTMLSKEQSTLITLFCDSFNVSLNGSLNPSTTHLIVATRGKNGLLLAKRSFKYLQARLSPETMIVSINWIDECLKRKRIINEDDYIVDGDEETSGVAVATSANIFTDMQFYFYGEAYLKPSLPDLLTLSKSAKATIIETVEQLKGRHGLIVFASPSEDRFEKDAGVIEHYKPIISSAWILDCISLGRLLNMKNYHIL